MGDLSVSVVLLAYTERRWTVLGEALDSVRAQTRPPDEIVVVVDHNPALLERVRAAWPDVVVVASDGPERGESPGRNASLPIVQGEIVAFIDDDAIPEPDWLERLLAAYEQPDVAAVGGHLEPRWEEPRPRWFGPEYDWIVGCSHSGMPRRPEPVRNLIGANMSFRRDAMLATGVFDSGLGRVGTRPYGCPETEYCIRLQRRLPGAVVLYEPRARVHHHVPPERARWSYFVHRCYGEGRSKARVTRLAGRRAVESESRYVVTTLPRALVAGARAWRRGGLLRVAAVGAGVAVAAAGYAVELVVGWQPRAGRRAAGSKVLASG